MDKTEFVVTQHSCQRHGLRMQIETAVRKGDLAILAVEDEFWKGKERVDFVTGALRFSLA